MHLLSLSTKVADILHNAIAKTDDYDEEPCQSPLEGRDQFSKDQQA